MEAAKLPPQDAPKEAEPKKNATYEIRANIESVNSAIAAMNDAKGGTGNTENETCTRHESRMFWLEFAGVIGLGVYCAVTIFEWRTFDSERKTMETELSNSIAASDKQLNIFQGQLDEMKHSSELDERAWVCQSEVTFATNGSDATIIVVIKNTGKTLALKVHGAIGYTTFSELIPQNDTNFMSDPHSNEILPPGGASHHSCKINQMNQADVDRLRSGKDGYVFGTTWYDDIFGKHHWTQFCYIISPTYDNFKAAPFHNSCDDAQTNQTN